MGGIFWGEVNYWMFNCCGFVVVGIQRWGLPEGDYILDVEGVELYEDVEIQDSSIVAGKEVVMSRKDAMDRFNVESTPELSSSQTSIGSEEGKWADFKYNDLDLEGVQN